MINGSCHCGAVTFKIRRTPQFLLECNCSICRRLASQWVYSDKVDISLSAPEGSTLAYIWGDKEIEFHTCKTCGCTTHYMAVDQSKFAVNCRMSDPEATKSIPIRHFDGADSWKFLD